MRCIFIILGVLIVGVVVVFVVFDGEWYIVNVVVGYGLEWVECWCNDDFKDWVGKMIN